MIREVTPQAVSAGTIPGKLIDVREPGEFIGDLGHAAAAQPVPLAAVERVCAAWNRDEPLVLVCRSGARSMRAAQLLATLGFRHLFSVQGGMLGWNAAGLPVVR